MPTAFPKRRSTGFKRWHILGLTLAYVTAALVLLWVAIDPIGKFGLRETAAITTGIAPADQSGKSLPR